MTTHRATAPDTRLLLSKVPEVTAYFWIIKVLCTTVGESAADFLNVNVNLGLTGTSVATGVLLVIVLAAQFRRAGTPRPVLVGRDPGERVRHAGHRRAHRQPRRPARASTLVFAVLLAASSSPGTATEGTLSIHSIRTRRREAFYWLAILVTFALGTATGDLMAQVLGLGYLVAGITVAVVSATAIGWRLGCIPCWRSGSSCAHPPPGCLDRGLPVAADRRRRPRVGATLTSLIFFAGIIAVVVYLSVTKADVIRGDTDPSRGA